ncbi:accessory gland protein Acp29AB [Drosophila eugracilis]|uniref:accessory gland protein Acp29AB n=1 Tax=Drosophila eugracilis TaxID=29029 RepID=UPI001BD95167|nr:accessory gland protein Acp29AB [Drosophila eugracilis]
MLPLLDYIAKQRDEFFLALHNQTLSKLGALEDKLQRMQIKMEESIQDGALSDLKERVDGMEVKQVDAQKSNAAQLEVQINLEKNQKDLLAAFKNYIPQDFAERLGKIEALEAKAGDQLAAVQRNLVIAKIPGEGIYNPKFELIGSRKIYIERYFKADWSNASRVCRTMGGSLATFKNQEELEAVGAELTTGLNYWLGITDHEVKGTYLHDGSGNTVEFFNWKSGQPNNYDGKEDCVEIISGEMNDTNCAQFNFFICQADDV